MPNQLTTDQRLEANGKLVSPNGQFSLVMQSDGNLVLYHGNPSPATAYWSTSTYNLPAGMRPTSLVMQSDANLVLYDTANRPHWASGTWGPGYDNPQVTLQDDGNLVITHHSGEVIWASGTFDHHGAVPGKGYVPAPNHSPDGPTAHGNQMNPGEVLHAGDSVSSANGNYRLTMQSDGNLVLYSGSLALWATNTFGKPAVVCIMQGDGNLVLYDSASHPLWASNTDGKPGAHLVVQDDGNVVIYETNGNAPWATNTVHTVGQSTLIYRTRIKRWTSIPLAGTKGNDTIVVQLPPGSTFQSVVIAPIDSVGLDPNANSPIGTQIGVPASGVRLTGVYPADGGVAITTHWWFDAFADVRYSISVWVSGPTPYPIQDDGALSSFLVNDKVVKDFKTWYDAHSAELIAVGTALGALIIDLASLGTATPVTTAVLIAAVSTAAAAGTKLAINSIP